MGSRKESWCQALEKIWGIPVHKQSCWSSLWQVHMTTFLSSAAWLCSNWLYPDMQCWLLSPLQVSWSVHTHTYLHEVEGEEICQCWWWLWSYNSWVLLHLFVKTGWQHRGLLSWSSQQSLPKTTVETTSPSLCILTLWVSVIALVLVLYLLKCCAVPTAAVYVLLHHYFVAATDNVQRLFRL